jgi:predicted TIM-barrel fold metal-dependent hydrolase
MRRNQALPLSMMPDSFNVHVHCFTMRCAPVDLLRSYRVPRLVMRHVWPWLSRPWAAERISRMLRTLTWLAPGKERLWKRYAEFLRVGLHKNQQQLFEELLDQYAPNVGFVVLTLNMDHMAPGRPEISYREQLHFLQGIRQRYPNRFLPFYCVDPRAGSPEAVLTDLRRRVETEGYAGIKLYPALGFWPFDKRMDPIWAYAAENQLPVVTHCNRGGINYVGAWTKEQLTPTGEWEPQNAASWPADFARLAFPFKPENQKQHKACDDFGHPFAYVRVLERFPGLKLCFAHAGGAKEILWRDKEKSEKDSWFVQIRHLMRAFPNVYTDISYALHDKDVHPPLAELIADAALGSRVLFGTDYFMTTREKPEPKLASEFRDYLGTQVPGAWDRISRDNPREWLHSKQHRFMGIPARRGTMPV